MVTKWAGGLLAAYLVLSCAAGANAAEQMGTIRISLDPGELPVTNGAVTLYYVGSPTVEGYQITGEFGGGIVKAEDATSTHLAQWLAESAGDLGRTVFLDVEGDVTFSNLEPGLYLAVQTQRMDGFYPFKPFLAALPSEESWELSVEPPVDPIIIDNPQTGQTAMPLLGAMGMVISGLGLYLCFDNRGKK
jgi:LPXTG-motif cell wall-anchored protein